MQMYLIFNTDAQFQMGIMHSVFIGLDVNIQFIITEDLLTITNNFHPLYNMCICICIF